MTFKEQQALNTAIAERVMGWDAQDFIAERAGVGDNWCLNLNSCFEAQAAFIAKYGCAEYYEELRYLLSATPLPDPRWGSLAQRMAMGMAPATPEQRCKAMLAALDEIEGKKLRVNSRLTP